MERVGAWPKAAEQVYHPRHLTQELLPHTAVPATPDNTEVRRGQGKIQISAIREAPGSRIDGKWWAKQH